MKKLLVLSIVISILLSSCKTAQVNIDVLKPAEINIPGNHSKITVINRSIAGKGYKGNNFVEGLFSGEGIHQDRNASYLCVNSFAISVNEAPKYLVNFADDFEITGTGTDLWPMPIPWDTVRQITDFYNTDILIALETFDTDSRTYSDTKQSDDNAEYLEGIEITINAGWRIYDPGKEIIIDQNNFIDFQRWEDQDDNADEARDGIPSKKDAVKKAGTYAGHMYAMRISPTWTTESRLYFRTNNEQLKLAHKYVRKRNWKSAFDIWNKLKDSDDMKIAAYSLHNLAVYYEINDNIEMAIEYANKAYAKYQNTYTMKYVNILLFRQTEISRLNEQLN